MNIENAINDIRNANSNNRLVVFVGAGVSMNSGVPSWTTLVHDMGLRIEHSKSLKIEEGENLEYTSDDLLRIPEYFYLKSHEDYYSLLQNTFTQYWASNSIDSLVYSINPHHIITTNYDHLLEESTHVYRSLFTTVAKDTDLLSQANQKYLIKMHGDIDNISEIVLKESDYLEYEQNHPLITNFIKSLLINHTFIFIGYGLNDNNLNLIISWINYYCKNNNIENRPINYLVSTEKYSYFDIERLKTRNIEVIQLFEEKEKLLSAANIPADISDEKGKLLYTFLSSIIDNTVYSNFTSFENLIIHNSKQLSGLNRFGLRDFLNCAGFKNCEIIGSTIHVLEKDRFERTVEALQNDAVKELFSKAGITCITYHHGLEKEEIEIPCHSIQDPLFELYLSNKYIELKESLKDCNTLEAQLYYAVYYDNPKSDISNLIEQLPPDENFSTANRLLNKIRNQIALMTVFDHQDEVADEIRMLIKLLNDNEKNSLESLLSIFSGNYKNRSQMHELLSKQEARYYERHTSYSGHSWIHLLKLQSYVYDAYYFVKENYIPIDYFLDLKKYFSDYIQALLCSYFPSRKIEDESNWTHLEPYVLNKIDVDIIVKFSNHKVLKKYLDEYKVNAIKYEEGIDLIELFTNLSNSIIYYGVYYWFEYLVNLSLLLYCSSPSKEDCNLIYQNLINVYISSNNMTHESELLKVLSLLITKYGLDDSFNNEYGNGLLDNLLFDSDGEIKNYSNIENKLISKFAKYKDDQLIAKCNTVMQSLNDVTAAAFRFNIRKLYSESDNLQYFSTHYQHLNFKNISFLLFDKYLDFNDEIGLKLFELYELAYMESDKQKDMFGYSTFDEYTNLLLAFPDFGIDIDLAQFEGFKDKSDYLKYFFEPNSFDYSLVNLSDYIWENMFRSSRLRKELIKHKGQILSPQLKSILNNGTATNSEMKIVYGFLLSEDEVFSLN